MKNQMVTMMAAVVIAAGLSSQAAKAGEVVAKVPFEFRAGRTILEPGTYRLVTEGFRMIVKDASSGRNMAVALVTTHGHGSADSKLVFHLVGGQYFLQSIYNLGDMTQLPTTAEEKRLRKQGEDWREAHIRSERMVAKK